MGYDGDIENISLDGYMFYGKEEHFPVSSLQEAYGWLFGEGIARSALARLLALCACKVWYRIWGRLQLCKVSVRAA